ncbi:hypothetical protein GCM10023214_46480 [Amycolatopsis dongchuanensis]|uniref:Uncharacterized protein n=1 Tax=Amycolatopsis dongchuanensis TaxID=1070866 RepID=A0ABP9QYC1_9PSEU
MRQPEDIARRLLEGLRNDEFLISCVPGTRERLVADAERGYRPARLDHHKRRSKVIGCSTEGSKMILPCRSPGHGRRVGRSTC